MRSLSLSTLLAFLTLVACSDRSPAAPATPAQTPRSAPTHQVVNLPLGDDLPQRLAEHAALAKQAKLAPFVELWADWCGPCKELEAAMHDPRIERAFAGVYLIRLDADQWGPKLAGTGLASGTIPVFYALDEQGKTTGRTLDGGAWAENTPENMAPPLDAFFHAKKP